MSKQVLLGGTIGAQRADCHICQMDMNTYGLADGHSKDKVAFAPQKNAKKGSNTTISLKHKLSYIISFTKYMYVYHI